MTQHQPTAGLGDPYWYEWSVGQGYIISMLEQDQGITSVTLQKTGGKGLDDVVVRFASGDARFVQVKHTRADDTLSFGDLVSPANGGSSLLKTIADSWAATAKVAAGKCEALLVTNRRSGTRSAAGGSEEPVSRPPLQEFLFKLREALESASSLQEIALPDDWRPAWEREWLPQLESLEDDAQRLLFLRSFKIQTSEKDLPDLGSELLARLQTCFGVTQEIALGMLSRLDNALRTWATSYRGREEAITPERVYEVLALGTEKPVGQHALAPPAPFFATRVEIADQVAAHLKQRKTPITFLSGEPGSGKTAVVSALANRREPVLDLRYHAYRPITPESQLVPADAGVTTTGHALWGDLLIQVRMLAKGRLARLRVPIHTAMLDTEKARAEVLRIANALGEERGEPVVVAIDGIDHAARAGASLDSLLATLIPPDQVPAHVVFLIAGQPSEAYPSYPPWLRSPAAGVGRIELPRLGQGDTQELVKARVTNLGLVAQEVLAQEIHGRCDGHTLATVFAVEEAAGCAGDASKLSVILDQRRIALGIEAYYESIWVGVTKIHRLDEPTAVRLAASLALSPTRTTGALVASVMSTEGHTRWTDVLRMLRPLIVEEEHGFRVFHNDVRVFLLRKIQAEEHLYRACASAIADYLVKHGSGAARHEAVLDLLGIARRFVDQAELFTPAYVVEGHVIGRSVQAIAAQGIVAASALLKEGANWERAHSVACGLRTLGQLDVSLDSAGGYRAPERIGTSSLRPVERAVTPIGQWTEEVLKTAVSDIELLHQTKEFERARAAFGRWFDGLSPASLFAAIKPDREIRRRPDDYEARREIVAKIGEVAVGIHVDLPWSVEDGDEAGHAEASYAKGLLAAICDVTDDRRFVAVLGRVERFFPFDFQRLLTRLTAGRNWRHAGLVLEFLERRSSRLPWALRIQAAAISSLSGDERLRTTWATSLLSQRTAAVAAAVQASGYDDEEITAQLATMSWLALCLGYEESHRDPSAIRQEVDDGYRATMRDERADGVVSQVLYSAALLGAHLRALATGAATTSHLTPDVLARVLTVLMGSGRGARPFPPLGFGFVSRALVEGFADAVAGSASLAAVIRERCREEVSSMRPLGQLLEVAWRILHRHGHVRELVAYANGWVGLDGRAWSESLFERRDLVERFSSLLEGAGQIEEAQQARSRLLWAPVGYLGRKEYALGEPLQWFETLCNLDPSEWRTTGLTLLGISRVASMIGENRLEADVTRAVVAAACVEGPMSIDRLLRADGEWIQPEDAVFAQALARMSRRGRLARGDLYDIWAFCTGQLDWQVERDRVPLGEVRDDLIEAAKAIAEPGLASEMEAASPAEFGIGPSSDRKADDEKALDIDGLPPLEAARVAIGVGTGEHSWRSVVKVVRRLDAERPAGTAEALALIWTSMLGTDHRRSWSFDGRDDVFAAIFPLMSTPERWQAMRAAVERQQREGVNYRFAALAENMEHLCFLEATLSGRAELRAGLGRLLDMHLTWVSGAGHLPVPRQPILAEPRSIAEWSALFAGLLLRLLAFDDENYVQAALRGLYRLLLHRPERIPSFVGEMRSADSETRRRVLLIVEPLAVATRSKELQAWLEEMLDDPELDLALSAWVGLGAYARLGNEVRSWPKAEEDDGTTNRVVPVATPLLRRSGSNHGVHTTVGRPSSRYLELLDGVTETSIDDLEAAFASAERDIPYEGRDEARTRDAGGSRLTIGRDAEVERLMKLLRRHERAGRFRETSLLMLAQALVPAVDPYVFLRTPAPMGSEDEWPVDEVLEKLLLDGDELEKRLKALCSAGLSPRHRLLGALLTTCSARHDVVFRLEHVATSGRYVGPSKPPSVLNGRSFLAYELNDIRRSDQTRGRSWLTERIGGLFMFIGGTVEMFPARSWLDPLGWKPSADDPLLWMRDDQKVAWFERRCGPTRRVYGQDFVHRQPVLNRWVCTAEEWERLAGLMGQAPVEMAGVEVGRLGQAEE